MNRRTVDSQLAPLVNAAAYDLLAEGRNPTVRAVRERVRASNNDVTAALAVWRQGLKAQLDAGLAEHGIPSHVASYVRLGIRAAEQLRASNEGADTTTVVDVLERRNAALEAEVRLRERERSDLKETSGRLEAELSLARARAAGAERAQQLHEAGRGELGRLKAELTAARVALAESNALAAQVPGLEQSLAQAQGELEALQVEIAAAKAKRRARPRARASAASASPKRRAPAPPATRARRPRRAKVARAVRSAPKRAPAKRAARPTRKRSPRAGTPRRGGGRRGGR